MFLNRVGVKMEEEEKDKTKRKKSRSFRKKHGGDTKKVLF
jgi:hypothetical protein